MSLRINPEPIKIVSQEQRDVWTKVAYRWRCCYLDGRGQCSSRETHPIWLNDIRGGAAYCEKHMPEQAAPKQDGEVASEAEERG